MMKVQSELFLFLFKLSVEILCWVFLQSFALSSRDIFIESKFFPLLWYLCAAGLALLRFRERVVSDPFGALTNWNDDVGVVNPCSWHGIECSDGNVVSL